MFIMKKSLFKKTAAIAASVIMAAAAAVPAMTASADYAVDFKDSGKIIKEILVTTEDTTATTVAAPYIKYTYEITPATVAADVKVTDKDNATGPVTAGPTGGLTIADAAKDVDLKGEDVTVSAGAGKITKEIPITYDEAAFKADGAFVPGIYRYEITETTDAEKASVGVVEPADYAATRFIDVYVDADGIYGTVMFAANDSVTYEGTQKTLGYTDESNTTKGDTDPTKGLADTYPLFNYTVEKKVENSMLPNPEFNFTVAVTGVAGQKFTAEGAEKTIAADTKVEKTLKDGGIIELKNIPANVQLAVSEANPNQASYTVNAVDETAGALITGGALEIGGTQGFDAKQIATIASGTATKALGAKTTFTNRQTQISPTGIVFMIAPFVIMLAAGAFLTVLFMKNRKKDAAESII